ncbi:MAG TPA: transglycosylase domain-containing protein, partial [Candidatus Eisenbacteria bacterium]|nr:transglycosylase domain-containing protein [Candidatus Eisenbacteria bacterium]
TQQLVRARLLPEKAFEGSVYDRKLREIIQSIRLTQAFPGETGKEQIITAYLNQNFYGNQSYGIKAAAESYFGKALADLTLAEAAILAAIPQSPTKFDLARNAVQQCTVELGTDGSCPAGSAQAVVPATAEIVVRRNQVLKLMETRSVLSGSKHKLSEYEAAIKEPVILSPQGLAPWKAPHFVWQVRQQLGEILCGLESRDACELVDTGGYKIITSLNWDMQQVVDKWARAAGRAPLMETRAGTQEVLDSLGISADDGEWVFGLRGKDINNSAAAVIDYRTGQVLAYTGSAGYYDLNGDVQFQPQYDVMGDGFRQPGSAIKPLNYITGLDDKTITPATMFMDVVTDFSGGRGSPYTPADADKLERGPVRMRPALQFSLNIPSIKASFINGFDHLFEKFKTFGLEFTPEAVPVTSMGIGTLEIHLIDLLSAFGAIGNSGTLVPRTYLVEIRDADNEVVWPLPGDLSQGTRVASEQASFLMNDILEGNTIDSVNRYWAAWKILDTDGTRRPAAYKTGTTDENKDIDAFGYLAAPEDPLQPALAVGVWLGNSDATAVADITSVASSAPFWSKIMTEVSRGMPIAEFKQPAGLVSAEVDAYSGLLPGPYTEKTVTELFIEGTVPTKQDNIHAAKDIDESTGQLWQEGCAGPIATHGYLDFSQVETAHPEWQPFTQEWAARAARGAGTKGGPRDTAVTYFFDGRLVPFGKSWGGSFAPTEVCTPLPPPTEVPTEQPQPTNPGGGSGGGGGSSGGGGGGGGPGNGGGGGPPGKQTPTPPPP